jgi:hypothetical protein
MLRAGNVDVTRDTGCSPAQMVFSVFHAIPGILDFGLSKFSNVLGLNISKYCPNAQYCLNLYLRRFRIHGHLSHRVVLTEQQFRVFFLWNLKLLSRET